MFSNIKSLIFNKSAVNVKVSFTFLLNHLSHSKSNFFKVLPNLYLVNEEQNRPILFSSLHE